MPRSRSQSRTRIKSSMNIQYLNMRVSSNSLWHNMYMYTKKKKMKIRIGKVLKSEVCNGSSIRSQIITDDCKRSTSLDNHVGDANSAEGVNRQATSGALNTENLTLAVLWSRECRAVGAVVIEEAVQTSTVDDDVFAVKHTEAEGITVTREAGAVVGIVEGGVGWVWAVGSIGVRLVVSKRGISVHFDLLKPRFPC